MRKSNLVIRLGAAIVIGIVVGTVAIKLGIEKTAVFTFVARSAVTFTSLFSTFLNFIIPILILSFIAVGLADLRSNASKMVGLTLAIAYASTITSGLSAFFITKNILPRFIGSMSELQDEIAAYDAFFILELDPLFSVMTALFLAFILGIGMASIKGTTLVSALKDLQNIISKLLERVIIPLIPVHIACLFLTLSAQGRFLSLAKTFAYALFLIIILQLIYLVFEYAVSSIICRKNQMPKMKNAILAYLTALGTQSSAATIPITLKCAYKNEIRKDIADFCIPLCATIHLAGDTIAIVVAAEALMLSGGMQIEFFEFLPFILMLGVTMIAAPGVPGGGVMSALALLESMLGFNTNLQQLMIAIHFAQDSFGTATNVTGDLALAQIVDKFYNTKLRQKNN